MGGARSRHEVQIVREAGRQLAVTRFEAPVEQIPDQIGRAFGVVMAHLAALGVTPQGPAVCVYESAGPRFRVAAGFVVDQPIVGDGAVVPLRLRTGDVATTTHIGPYADLPAAYAALETGARDLGRQLDRAAPMWEEYWSPPETPPEETRTVVSWPVTDTG